MTPVLTLLSSKGSALDSHHLATATYPREHFQEPPALCAVLSCVQLFATPWTVPHQAPLPMDFPGKNTGVGCHFVLQGIFPNQGSNSHLLCLLHCRQILDHCVLQGNLPDPGIELMFTHISCVSLHWQADSLPLAPPGKPGSQLPQSLYHL